MQLRSRTASLLLLLLLPLEASATKPAVKELNGRVLAGYGYEHLDGGSQLSAGSLRVVPASDRKTWVLGGVVTAPLLDVVGARVFFAGGRSRLESQGVIGFRPSNTNTGLIGGGAMVFLRNPEFGHAGLGYRVTWENLSSSPVDTTLTHELLVDAGFYIPDNGLGPIDWDFAFSWGRASVDTFGPKETVDEYMLDGTVGWYFGRSLRAVAGIHWLRTQPEIVQPEDDLRGVFRLDWLVPFPAERRFVTATFFSSFGRIDQGLPFPFTPIRRNVYSVGGELTFSYPGAASLVELIREYH